MITCKLKLVFVFSSRWTPVEKKMLRGVTWLSNLLLVFMCYRNITFMLHEQEFIQFWSKTRKAAIAMHCNLRSCLSFSAWSTRPILHKSTKFLAANRLVVKNSTDFPTCYLGAKELPNERKMNTDRGKQLKPAHRQQIVIRTAMCLVAINILLRLWNTSIMLSIDMQFMLN